MGKLFDRSRVTTDWKCRRRRYLNYEHNGTGIVSGAAAYELFFGTVIHDGLATGAEFHQRNGEVPVDDIALAGYTQVHDTLMEQLGDAEYAIEQAWLASGLLRGFFNYQWPKLLELYPEIVVIEQELVAGDFMHKPDLIVRSPEGTLLYIEYKTTSSINDKWKDSWVTNPQLHSYLRGIREATGLEVAAAVVVGLYKGYHDARQGKQNSPFCYAYFRPGNPPFTGVDVAYKWKAGYKKLPVWENDIAPADWVDNMPEEVLAEQFMMLPPIYLNEHIADTFFRQARLREQDIQTGLIMLREMAGNEEEKRNIMDIFFQQNLEGCRPGWGSSCPYASICIDGVSPDDARWQPRQPHHTPEAEQMKETV
jgi:hypothetical protein